MRKRRKKTLSRNKRRRRFFSSIVFLFLVIGSTVLITNLFFKIETIEVIKKGSLDYTNNEIIAVSGIQTGKTIFSFKTDEVVSNLIVKLPFIGSAKVERKLPRKVKITVSEVTEYASIPYKGGFLIVGKDLKVLSDASRAPMNTMSVYGLTPSAFNTGSRLKTTDETTPETLGYLFNEISRIGWFDKVTAVNVRDKLNIMLVYKDSILVTVGTQNNLDYKFDLMKEVIENRLEEGFAGTLDISVSGQARSTPGEFKYPMGFFDIGDEE
ncbi:MAG: FtsQ-type POTRA domain-containing protein [Ruminococcaceae bacterium]|nr:FtsQ-type POTRA domain-containing protein [Oscillospiraceae bacterium]